VNAAKLPDLVMLPTPELGEVIPAVEAVELGEPIALRIPREDLVRLRRVGIEDHDVWPIAGARACRKPQHDRRRRDARPTRDQLAMLGPHAGVELQILSRPSVALPVGADGTALGVADDRVGE